MRIARRLAAVLIGCLAGSALAQTDARPTLEAHDIFDPDAAAKMQACSPRATPAQLAAWRDRVAKTPQNFEIGFVGEEGDANGVVHRSGLWLCLPLTRAKLPVLPVDLILQTVTPVGAEPAAAAQYAREVSASLTQGGFARGLMPMENGNAYVVMYAVSADKPYEVAFDTRLLKAGEYKPAEYAIRLGGHPLKTVAIAGGKRRDVVVGKTPTRQVVDNFLIRPASPRTAAFDFGGTTWVTAVFPKATFTFQKEGALVYRGKTGTSFGNWRLKDGVLYFDLNGFTYYSAVIDDTNHLNAEARNTAKQGPTPGENRFRLRLYQQGDAVAEKQVKDFYDNMSKAMQTLVDMERQRVLGESQQDEARAEEAAKKNAEGKSRQTLCPEQAMSLAFTVAEFRNTTVGEMCSSFFGTRKEWKETILREGCNKRCSYL